MQYVYMYVRMYVCTYVKISDSNIILLEIYIDIFVFAEYIIKKHALI